MTLPTAPSRTMSQDTFDSTTDAFIGALPQFETDMNALAAAMSLNATTDTSATSNSIGTGAKTFTVSASKSFWPGMWLVIADTAAPTTNAMFVQVTSYSGTTLVVNSVSTQGSGTKTAWQISQSAPASLGGLYAATDEYTAASTACTRALTAAVVWRLVRVGKIVTLHLPPVFGTTDAGGGTNFTFGVALPAAYRPTADIAMPIVAMTQNNVPSATPGVLDIRTTGSIIIWRDGTFTSNFGSGIANTGVQQATTVSWVIA